MSHDESIWRCWCGDEGDPDEMCSDDLDESCGGTGTLHCYCGGDFCVCHNHGEVQCTGCEDCETDEDRDGEDFWAQEDYDRAADDYEPPASAFKRHRQVSTDPRRKRARNKRLGGRLLGMKERGRR